MLAEKVNENIVATVIRMPDRKNQSYIQNNFFDAVAKTRIPGEQMQILSAIARKTWCWGKDSDLISKSQIVQATGISKTHIDRAIKALVNRNILIVTKNGNYSMQEFEINTKYDEWLPVTKKGNVTKIGNGVTKKGNKKLPNMGPTKDNKDTYTKDIKNSSCPGFENPDEQIEKPAVESSSKKSKKYIFDESHAELAELLAAEILKNKPDFKLPSKNSEWSDTVRLMVDRDSRRLEDIRAVIIWSQQDQFWKNNVLSMSAVRRHFDKLQIKSRSKPCQQGFQNIHDRNRQACEDFIKGDW